MNKRGILCLAVMLMPTAFAEITLAEPLQSVSSKQSQIEAEILDLPELVARIKPSVVTILTFDAQDKPAGQGSGFFIAKDRIVTNHHVIRGAARAEIKLNSGATIEVIGLLAFDRRHDLALLKVNLSPEQEAAKITPLKLAAKMPREGERIVVIGSPRGLEHTVSEGIVSAIRELPGFGTIIQMTAAISPGSSGSPVLNMRGEVIAVVRSIVVDAQSLNFAVAIEHVVALRPQKIKQLNESVLKESEGSDEARQEVTRGMAAFLADDYQKALVHFRRVVEIKPDAAAARSILGMAYFMLGRYQEAIVTYKQSIRIKPNYATAHFTLGMAYGKVGRYEEAIVAYKQAIRIQPDDPKVHLKLGVVYSELSRWQEAIDSCKQAIRIKPDYAKAHYNIGVVYGKLGRDQEAINPLRLAIRIKPDYANAHNNLGVVYDKLGRYRDAITAYKQAIRIKPVDAQAHSNLGLVYSKLERRQEAIDAYKQAIRIKPDDAQTHSNLGLVYLTLGRSQEAMAACKQAIRIRPDFADAHYNLGLIYLIVDKKGLALDEYKILKELNRDLAKELFSVIYD